MSAEANKTVVDAAMKSMNWSAELDKAVKRFKVALARHIRYMAWKASLKEPKIRRRHKL